MKRLVLFRHGIAVPHGTDGVEESQRPLTPQGERRTRRVARGLKPLIGRLDRIITSPLPRAGKTAEIVADVLRIPDLVEVSDELIQGSSAEGMRAFVEARPEERIMLVGHNPGLSNLLALVVTGSTDGGSLELRKAGAASLRRDETGRYRLDWLVRPRFARFLG